MCLPWLNLDLLDAQQDVGFLPEAFQIIEFALFLAKDVHDHVAVVHQHPAAVRLAFDRDRQPAVLILDGFAHALGDGANLAVAVSCADDEKIGDNRIGAEVEQDDVLGFLTFDSIDNMVG